MMNEYINESSGETQFPHTKQAWYHDKFGENVVHVEASHNGWSLKYYGILGGELLLKDVKYDDLKNTPYENFAIAYSYALIKMGTLIKFKDEFKKTGTYLSENRIYSIFISATSTGWVTTYINNRSSERYHDHREVENTVEDNFEEAYKKMECMHGKLTDANRKVL